MSCEWPWGELLLIVSGEPFRGLHAKAGPSSGRESRPRGLMVDDKFFGVHEGPYDVAQSACQIAVVHHIFGRNRDFILGGIPTQCSQISGLEEGTQRRRIDGLSFFRGLGL